MWTLIIALLINTEKTPFTFIPIANVETYEQCRELSATLKKYALNDEVQFYCVKQE